MTQPPESFTEAELNLLNAIVVTMENDFHNNMAEWEYQDRTEKEDKMTGNRDLMFGVPPDHLTGQPDTLQ